MRKEWKKNILGIISIVLFGLFPCLVIYFKNAGETKIIDVAPVMLIYLVIATVVLICCKFVFRKLAKAIAMTNMLMVVLCNYELFAEAFGESSYKYFFLTAIVIVVLVGTGLLIRRLKEDFVVNLNEVFCITFAVLIVINGIPAIPTIVHKMTVEVKKGPELKEMQIEKVNSETAPNIYYMIFDEYGGYQNLKELLDYDNSEFLDGLRNMGFSVSDNSYNKESVWTTVIVPNLLNFNYVVYDEMDGAELQKYMALPDMYFVMERLGYEINTCSHVDFLDNSISKNSFRSVNYFENQAGYEVLKRSLFFELYSAFANEKSKGYGEDLISSMDYYMKLSDLALNEELPQFSLAYFQVPHIPHAFKEDGTPVVEMEKEQWTSENYLSYLKWANGKIEEILRYLIERDPTAVIIVQSDHGSRHCADSVVGLEEGGEKDIYQHNILNCVYYKGEVFDIEGLSGINTLRKVWNAEFGLNMEMLEYTPDTQK